LERGNLMDKTMPRLESSELPMERCNKCSICKTIPNKTGEFYKGGVLDGDPLPESVHKLKILGVPYFDDSTSHSNYCLKQCPECGTYYRWEMEYEYLVNGSEDDIGLFRLSDTEGESRKNLVLESVKKSRQDFIDTAIKLMPILNQATNIVLMKKAADHLYHYQLVYEEDITFTVPAVITALIKHKHYAQKCEVGQSLFWLLRNYANINEKNRGFINDLLKDADPISNKSPEVVELIKHFESKK
jgi:hypothetical protein